MIGLPENCILPGRIPRNGKTVLVAPSLAFQEVIVSGACRA